MALLEREIESTDRDIHRENRNDSGRLARYQETYYNINRNYYENCDRDDVNVDECEPQRSGRE